MVEMEAVERKRSRGGFLNMFDWPGKSRKKLFSSSSSSSKLSGNVYFNALSVLV
jgi:hypothetical protein